MDFCPHCGAGVLDGMKRCPECRRSVEKNSRGEFNCNDRERGSGANLALAIVLITVLVIICAFVIDANYAYPSVDEPAYTETIFFDCKKSGEQAYADIVDIIPVLNVYSGEEITKLICRCTAASGETFAMYIEVSQFAENFDSNIWSYLGDDYEETISFAPIRVYGESVYYGDIVMRVPNSVYKTILLRFVSVE